MAFPLGAMSGAVNFVDVGGNAATSWIQNWMNQNAVNAQNDYNSPKNQMLRYKEAGLNPNLVYSQGTPGNQSAPVQMSAPQLGSSFHSSVIPRLQAMNLEKDIEQKDANIRATEMSTVHRALDSDLLRYKLMFEDTRRPFYSDISQHQMSALQARYNAALWDANLKQVEVERRKADVELKNQKDLEFKHYNYLRQFGAEKHDSPWIRGTLGIGKSLWDAIQKYKLK